MNRHRFAELHIFQTEMTRVHGPRQHGQHRLEPEGFQYIIKRAHLHRIDGRLDRALAGHHDADHVGIDLHRLTDQCDAVDDRHHQIRQEHIKYLGPQRPERLLAVTKAHGFIALRNQGFDEDVLEFRLVINHQNSSYVTGRHNKFAAAPFAVAGNNIWTVVPRPISLSISIDPPCSSTMRRQMAIPSPVPLPSGLVVKNGSQIFSRCSGAMPSPVSANSMATASVPSSHVASTRTKSLPPCGIASLALVSRLRNSWRNCWRSA